MRTAVFLIMLSLNLFGQNYWKELAHFTNASIEEIAVDSEGRIFAAPFNSGYIYYSFDNGATWDSTLVDTVDYSFHFQAVAVGESDIVYAGTRNNGAFYSADHGLTWNGPFLKYAEITDILPVKDYVLITNSDGTGGVFKTDKFLSNEQLIVIHSEWQDYFWRLATDGTNIYSVLRGGLLDGIYYSTDDGITWEKINTLNNLQIALCTRNNELFSINYSGMLYHTNNLGTQWDSVSTGVTDVWDIEIAGDSSIFVSSATYGMYYSGDLGATWQEFNSGITDTILWKITKDREGNLLVGSGGGYIYRLANPVTEIRAEENIPVTFMLYQNYPNPFNPTTTIKYSIPVGDATRLAIGQDFASPTFVNLKIYDALGREIATLVNERKSPGTYAVTFNAEGLSSGVYYYKIQAGDFAMTRKMILLK